MNRIKAVHEFGPVYDQNSRILILGSFPSVKSREQAFYYGHKQNRFWKVTSVLCNENVPETIEDKKAYLLRNGIALWDVIESCTIVGSSDSSIEDVVVNDIKGLLDKTNIREVYLNGNKAASLYRKYIYPVTGIEGIVLPSTSPANATWNTEKLIEKWQVIVPCLKGGNHESNEL